MSLELLRASLQVIVQQNGQGEKSLNVYLVKCQLKFSKFFKCAKLSMFAFTTDSINLGTNNLCINLGTKNLQSQFKQVPIMYSINLRTNNVWYQLTYQQRIVSTYVPITYSINLRTNNVQYQLRFQQPIVSTQVGTNNPLSQSPLRVASHLCTFASTNDRKHN